MSVLQFPRAKSKPRIVLSIEEIKRLYEASETSEQRAILSLYYGCGLRRTEGILLNAKDVHYRTGLLYVRDGKGQKRRVVPISAKVSYYLKNYYDNGRPKIRGNTAYLLNHYGERTGNSYGSKQLKILLEKAAIKKEISLHNLRHSIATHLLQAGVSLEYVQTFLGHSSIDSTQIYTRVSKQQLRSL